MFSVAIVGKQDTTMHFLHSHPLGIHRYGSAKRRVSATNFSIRYSPISFFFLPWLLINLVKEGNKETTAEHNKKRYKSIIPNN